MTDERTRHDPMTGTDEEPRDVERVDDQRRPSEEEDEGNPLLKEGPDAPDAADIEDPDEQL
jgi:hypothetical protein